MTLIGYWPLNETGTLVAADYAGKSNPATLNGDISQGASGILGNNSYDLDGSGDYLNNLSIPALNSFSYGLWCYLDDASIVRYAMRLTSNNDTLIRNNSNGNIEAQVFDGSNSSFATGPSTPTNQWFHVFAVWNGSTLYLYLDGEEVASVSVSSNANAGREDHIGASGNSSPSNYWDGRLSESRVYNHALSSQEIQYLYNVTKSATLTTRSTRL